MKYRWKDGEGRWVFIPILLIKNSYLRMIQKRYKKQVKQWEHLLIEYLNKNSFRGISLALRMLDRLASKLDAIAEEFYLREILGSHNFKYRGRIHENEIITA